METTNGEYGGIGVVMGLDADALSVSSMSSKEAPLKRQAFGMEISFYLWMVLT